jgi:NDP-sugar pyrophosphorylase family protein
MVLAAGLGTRLRPLTLDRPKPLVEVAGQPLITYSLRLLRRYGITDIIINLHHRGEALRVALGDGSQLGVRLLYSEEDPLLDTGGAIKRVEPLLGDDDFVVMNGDTIIDLPLDRLIEAHRTHAAAATLVLRHDPDQQRYGLIEVTTNLRVGRFLGRPERGPESLTPYMFAGVHVLGPRVFHHMPAGGAFSITRETYPAMLAAGAPLYGFPFDGYWRVVDTAADLRRAEQELAARSSPLHFLA